MEIVRISKVAISVERFGEGADGAGEFDDVWERRDVNLRVRRRERNNDMEGTNERVKEKKKKKERQGTAKL